MVAAGAPGPRSDAELSVDGDTYLSWAVINNSPNSIDYPFFIDVYLDDILVERWTTNDLGANQYINLTDWDELPSRLRLRPGAHTLKLVADSTDLVPETDESDQCIRVGVYLAAIRVRSCNANPDARQAPGPGSLNA